MLKTWLKISGLAKSSYYEWKEKLSKSNHKDEVLIQKISKIVEDSKGRYGYRRVTLALKNQGLVINHKRVYRIMKSKGLLCRKFHHKSRKYSSYKGTVGKVAKNILNRNFDVRKPNKVWLTDVTEFKVSNKKLYLSTILDLYNSEIISFSLSSSPNISFTNDSLKKALERHREIDGLIIHSDQGFHYQHHSWVQVLKEHGIKQSMSRKGNCLDNSPMENFFGILKQELFYGRSFEGIDELRQEIESYIHWYNNHRIKSKLKGLSPVEYRKESFNLIQA